MHGHIYPCHGQTLPGLPRAARPSAAWHGPLQNAPLPQNIYKIYTNIFWSQYEIRQISQIYLRPALPCVAARAAGLPQFAAAGQTAPGKARAQLEALRFSDLSSCS